jgi:hypothetical protein
MGGRDRRMRTVRGNEISRLGSMMRTVPRLIAFTLLGALACRHGAPEPCPPCPDAFRTDATVQAQIEAQWRGVARQLPATAQLDFRCMCFGTGPSTSVEGQNICLPADWEKREQTARAAHLASHRHQPPWTDHDDATCAVRVERALERETDAHALELETRRALGVVSTRYPFESDYFATPPAQRHRWLHDYLVAHPTGDGAVPGFAASYQARCR